MIWSNKKRLVWDARELNKLIDAAKLPLETLDDAAELLEKNLYGATSDLEAGYFQVGIAEEQKQLLGCAFEKPDKGRPPTSGATPCSWVRGEQSIVSQGS